MNRFTPTHLHSASDLYRRRNMRDVTTGFLLACLLGPFGLLYSNLLWGMVLSVVFALTLNSLFIPVLCWLTSICASYWLIKFHNQDVRARSEMIDTFRMH